MLTDGTKSIDCEFEENGALPTCGYETAHNSKLNWTLRSHGKRVIRGVGAPRTGHSSVTCHSFVFVFIYKQTKRNLYKHEQLRNA